MRPVKKHPGFTLIELLVVVGIVSLLMSVLLPGLAAAKRFARQGQCQSNLRKLGAAAAMYQAANRGYFWPCYRDGSYFWGTKTDPVVTTASVFLNYCGYDLANLWCPSLKWGSYVPQGGVSEPTTTYGYNAWSLDPAFWGRRDRRNDPMPRKRMEDLENPGEMFVFADSGMYWAPGGVPIFQNSTSLDPVTLGPWGRNNTPTTHFRHNGKANALGADGSAAAYGLDGGEMLQPERNLGFVGDSNAPHYDQE